MSNDEPLLSHFETSQWDAIVTREWPVDATDDSEPESAATDLVEACAADDGPRLVTVYRPRRPALAPLLAAALALTAGAWLIVEDLLPAYRLATLPSTSRHDRVAEIHALTDTTKLVGVALALAAGLFAVWVVAAARYRLRRSSFSQITSGAIPMTRYVRPPNPATAATWTLLLMTASGVAGWWIPLQLDRATGSGIDTTHALQFASSGAVAWIAVFGLCVAGLTTWAAREACHRLRRAVAARACSGQVGDRIR